MVLRRIEANLLREPTFVCDVLRPLGVFYQFEAIFLARLSVKYCSGLSPPRTA